MRVATLFVLGILTSAPVLTASRAAPSVEGPLTPGIHENVRFSRYPPIAEAPEVISRVLSPLAAEEVRRKLASSGKALQPKMFDIGNEEFVVYVPARMPAAGYGLLVFVPPWPKAEIPPGWRSVLDDYGVILISASRSGNEAEVLERRIPLALSGLANIRAMFNIDPSRTLIGGFSGGSRVAMRIALAYPDIFSGALLNAGSDPIGASPAHLPSPSLFLSFQNRTRIAYVTGDGDEGSQELDSVSQSSMIHWCVSNVRVHGDRGVAHEVASASVLSWALQSLFAKPSESTGKSAACRAARLQEVTDAIARAERALDGGDRQGTRRMLFDLDGKYGGLAAPRSITLAARCGCGVLDTAPASPRQ